MHETLKLFQCADCFNLRLHNSTSRWALNQGTWSISSTTFEERKKHLYGLLEETIIHLSELPKEGGQDAFSYSKLSSFYPKMIATFGIKYNLNICYLVMYLVFLPKKVSTNICTLPI